MTSPAASSLPAPRLFAATELRKRVAEQNFHAGLPAHPDNGDEERYRNRIASYSKGLVHKDSGEVDGRSYASFLHAVRDHDIDDFEKVLMGGPTPLIAVQSSFKFELEGKDSHAFSLPVPPRFDSREIGAEMAENYWMHVLRDTPFSAYATSPLAQAAAADLNIFGTDAKVPKNSAGQVTPDLLFRGLTAGDAIGPYISQFMYKVPPFGALALSAQFASYAPNVNYMTDWNNWLDVQRGAAFPKPPVGAPRFITNGRDLGRYVHIDVLFQAFQVAAMFLQGARAPLSPVNPYRDSTKQGWIGMFSELGQVTALALRAVFYQKWLIHRRLRPEVFAARLDRKLYHGADYPIHQEIIDSLGSASRLGGHIPAGNALLPMAYPEGSPTHPAYPAAHAVIAGACVTLLKAIYDESWPIPQPKQPTDDGSALVDYAGPPLELGDELNKLASNIGIGRNIAGVHWRSDATAGLELGEDVCIQFLRETRLTMHERMHFELHKLDGTHVRI
jgi:hypothetical protein